MMPEPVHELCRLCLAKDGLMIPIFMNQDPGAGVPFRFKIMTCADIEIFADDNLPTKICHICHHQVEKSFQFRNMCEKSDAALRSQASCKIPAGKSEDTSDSGSSVKLLEQTSSSNGWQESSKLEYELHFDNAASSPVQKKAAYFPCFACTKMCETPHDFIIHLQLEHADNVESYLCKLCNLVYATQSELVNHLNQKHIILYQCDRCDKAFKQEKNLETHKMLHASYKCKFCGDAFGDLMGLKKHERVHLQKVCRFCCKEFSNVASCLAHVRTCSQYYSCEFCKQVFSRKKELIEHVISCHDNNTVHKCSDCQKVFAKWEDVQDHACEFQEDSLQCKVCSVEFADLSLLENHMFEHSGAILSCKYCSKKFNLKSSLRRHEKSHSGLKPYQCKYCPRRFRDNSTCVVHTRTHTGEQPFQCQQCHKHFKQLANLKMHTYRHHKRSKLGPEALPEPSQDFCQEDPAQLYTGQVMMEEKVMQNVEEYDLDPNRVYQVLDIAVPDFEHNINMH